MSIILHGSFNSNNFGDTLLLKIFADYIKNKYPYHEIFATNTSKNTSEFCKVNTISVLDALRCHQPIVFCGGGYFGEPPHLIQRWSLNLWRKHLFFGLGAKNQQIPYAILGVGLGPLTKWWTRYPIVSLIRDAKICALRDKESVNYLHSYDETINCQQVADPILSYCSSDLIKISNMLNPDVIKQQTNKTSTQKIILHIPGRYENAEMRRFIAEWIVLLTKSRNDVELVVLADISLKNRPDFFSWLSNIDDQRIRIVEYLNPSQLLAEIIDSYGVITTKLHVGICGAILGKRVISFPFHAKTHRFYEQIKRTDICQPLNILNQVKAKELILNLINGKLEPIILDESIRQDSLKIWSLLDYFLESL
ncbi:polysaccharide pyruvyl transferase family protein [Geminocystis sp. GBBB08]|uniref:polysaccharide pyruvyl transferase family protein n=1 Tax=Geminocystis sp. GBBB08 TaxID=2604140 RepID=UPI0027E2B391|nr:polysaccharide pyruvyl transferase family protein [Geminocystis sp. GBBB08]MBL1209488.1 polysaccharide pyruvyl transferase family protein [Geminocystis sp. GBBB08]